MTIRSRIAWGLLAGLLLIREASPVCAQGARALTDAEHQTFEEARQALQTSIHALPGRLPADRADATIFAKGLEWALRYDRQFSNADLNLIKGSIARGNERVARLLEGKPVWRSRHGKVSLGYVSRVDGSVQPYGLIVPKDYEAGRPMRLDVVL